MPRNLASTILAAGDARAPPEHGVRHADDRDLHDRFTGGRCESGEREQGGAGGEFVRHNLRNKLQFWKSFACALVLSWVAFGLPLFFHGARPTEAFFATNHQSCFEHRAFVCAQVAKLLLTGAARRVTSKPQFVSPLGVAQHGRTGKLRLIFDLRHLNQEFFCESFHYEGIHTLRDIARPGDCALSFDLSAAYHHIPIAQRDWDFLGFEWEGGWYQFCALPFGYKPACWVFTRIVRELVRRWRSMGIRVVYYIDDWVFLCRPEEHATLAAFLQADILAAGFVINKDKCCGIASPIHTTDFLGHSIDFSTGRLAMMPVHVEHVKEMAANLAGAGEATVNQVQRFVGKIASTHLVTGRAARLHTFFLQRSLDGYNSKLDKHLAISLSPDARCELQWWLANLHRLSSSQLWPSRPHAEEELTVFSDAGEPGWGGHMRPEGYPDAIEAHGTWTSIERLRSSTWRELRAVILVIRSFASTLSGRRVLLHVDNQNCSFMWEKGSSHLPELVHMLKELTLFCEERTITLIVAWIPRRFNEHADFLSKIEERCDWQLRPEIAYWLLGEFGGAVPVADLFASELNVQPFCRTFFSKFHSPNSSGVNAFARNWGQLGLCWANPPFAIIGRVLRHARETRCCIIIILPYWERAAWWPLLLAPNGRSWAPFIRATRFLPASDDTFRPVSQANERAVGPAPFDCVAIFADFAGLGTRV